MVHLWGAAQLFQRFQHVHVFLYDSCLPLMPLSALYSSFHYRRRWPFNWSQTPSLLPINAIDLHFCAPWWFSVTFSIWSNRVSGVMFTSCMWLWKTAVKGKILHIWGITYSINFAIRTRNINSMLLNLVLKFTRKKKRVSFVRYLLDCIVALLYWIALLMLEAGGKKGKTGTRALPDPITDAVKAWTLPPPLSFHPLLLYLSYLKLIEISYLGNTGSGLLQCSPQPN